MSEAIPLNDSSRPAAILRPMDAGAGPELALAAVDAVGGRVEEELHAFLDERREALASLDPAAGALVDEIRRLLDAGGKRIRPAFCYLGHLAAGGEDGLPIVRAAAALELLHTFAIVHDDLMDESPERRGVPTTHVAFARQAVPPDEPERFGRSVAILVGDLAAVLAETMLRTSGFPADRLDAGFARFDDMRAAMAAGQFLDVSGAGHDPHVALLKTGSYTVEGPLLVGAALAAATSEVEVVMRAYAAPIGEAFQLRDDALDGDAPLAEASARLGGLVARAIAALEGAPIDPGAAGALRAMAAGLVLLEA